jgi:iron(III) transport system permease protein
VVVALALVFFALHYVPIVYQSAPLLVLAYAVLFLPLALIALRATLTQIPPGLAEMGRGLGRPPIIVLARVTLPLLGPGLAAAAALVFLSTTTELTATLLLRPTGMQTLATQFWVYTSGLAYGAAAPYAALMVAVSALPTYLLTRRIDSLSTSAT